MTRRPLDVALAIALATWAVVPSAANAQRPAAAACCVPGSDAPETVVPSLAGIADGSVAPSLAPRALFALPAAVGRPESGGRAVGVEQARRRARWAPVASAALPGSGQALLEQQRFLPYLALEGYAWLQFLADSREGRRQRSSYRTLARTVARAPLSSVTPSGNWEYYERMEHFVESGAYDVDPGGALQPEPDSTTYNGAVWLLARQTYWPDPSAPSPPSSAAYESALAFYRQRAVTPEYRWSWRNAELEQDVFRRTIARSNDAYRRAAQDLAVVIANHVLSTVDAYVTVRLRGRRLGAGARRPSAAQDAAYAVVVALPLSRVAPGSR